MNYRFVYLELKDFPGARRSSDRKRSQFKAPWPRTIDLLDRELLQLGATGVVFQAGFMPGQIRNDGLPYGKAIPQHPAVILSFRDAENRPLSFPCDRFESHEDNIRAIALSLEALRAVDRFGVTKRSEQYAGFKAIEAPKQYSTEDAAAFLGTHSFVLAAIILRDPDAYRLAYRQAAKMLHPDAGGNPHEWKLLQDAKELLNRHHGSACGAA